MFMKKMIATVMSIGVLSVCSMSAFAGTISGVGRTSGDPNGRLGSLEINYSITTKYSNGGPVAISAIEFLNNFASSTTCSVSSTSYYTPSTPSPDPVVVRAFQTGGYYTGDGGTYRCACKADLGDLMRYVYTVSTFKYDSPELGSFTGSLTKGGFDA